MGTFTKEQIENIIKNTEDLSNTYVLEKYCIKELGENNLEHVKHRIAKTIGDRVTRLSIKDINLAQDLILSDKFIPGGSILYGLKPYDYEDNSKSSLSNCFVIPIQNDSIEGIGNCITEIMRTYSYRGGCGVDITILRPAGEEVHNSSKSSSGSVSFMPLFSLATEILGQHGRRGALMITMDVRHPDIMKFIWSKAKQSRVFPPDAIGGFKNKSIDSANISVRLTDEFIEACNNSKPWFSVFPDRDADPELYDTKWTGDYKEWKKLGGKIKTRNYYELIYNKEDRDYFNDKYIWNDKQGAWILINEDTDMSNITDGTYVKIQYTFAKMILEDIAKAAAMRGDPGIQFHDTINDLSPSSAIDLPETTIISSNPCGEQPIPPYASCLLGAHILHRYVENPYTSYAHFDIDSFLMNSAKAVIAMNCFGLITENMHPLEEQRRIEKEYRKIGIEFTGLQDMLSMFSFEERKRKLPKQHNFMLDFKNDFIETIFAAKAIIEISISTVLAKNFGCIKIFDDKNHRKEFVDSEYITNLFNTFKRLPTHVKKSIMYIMYNYAWNNDISTDYIAGDIHIDNFIKLLNTHIMDYGLFNTGFNTVGPTGTLSVISDNCSSGIEPPFSFIYNRKTRIGDINSYEVGHNLILLNNILEYMNTNNLDKITSQTIEKQFNLKFAHDIDWRKRIQLQALVQKYIDSGISSTVNLPSSSTEDDVYNVYFYAHRMGLKGITIFIDGSIDSILNTIKDSDDKQTDILTDNNGNKYIPANGRDMSIIIDKENNRIKTVIDGEQYSISDYNPAFQLTFKDETIDYLVNDNGIIELREIENAKRHRVYWNGAKIYIIVTLVSDKVVEVFVKLPKEIAQDEYGANNEQLFNTYFSQWEAITRLVSMSLRANVPLIDVIKQLKKSVGSITDPMAVLIRVLNTYIKEDTPVQKYIKQENEKNMSPKQEYKLKNLGVKCPVKDCKGILRKIQGCNSCVTCGYSSCS